MASFLKNPFKSVAERLPQDGIYKYEVKDYDEMFRIPLRVLRLVGLRATMKDSAFASFCWSFFYWHEAVTLTIVWFLEVTQMIITARGATFDDAVAIFRMMPCIGYVSLALVKSAKIKLERRVVENLIDELRGMWLLEADDQQQRIISTSQRRLTTVIKGCYYGNYALLVIYLSAPFLLWGMKAAGWDVPLVLPFFYWLPIDQFQPGVYQVLLLMQCWHATLTIWLMLAADLMFCIFLSHITMQLELLSLRIQRLVTVDVDDQLIPSYPMAKNNHYKRENLMVSDIELEGRHEKELMEILARHRDLIRLTGDVENLYSFAMLVNFFNSSIVICFCGFCAAIVEKWNVIIYKSFLTTALLQTWMLCWYGQRLTETSMGVADALYCSGWYKISNKLSKSLFIMIQRSCKEVHITTYGFSVISLASYTTIIKTSWSYFTLLVNVYNKK